MLRTRAEIKENAKSYLRSMYMPMVCVGIIMALAGGALLRSNSADTPYSEGILFHFGSFTWKLPDMIGMPIKALLSVITLVLVILVAVYVKNPIEYGAKSWFRHLTDGTEEGRVFSAFGSPDYHRIVKTMFLRDVHVFVWSLLFVIPGFVKHYEYYFVPQLLEDHPDMTAEEILALCSDMTFGRKASLFEFDLSFFGWYLLEGLTRGISGILFSYPYKYMSTQLLYLDWQENGYDPMFIPEDDLFRDGMI